MPIKNLIVIILTCILNVYSIAQTTNYTTVHYTTDQGLPQNSIKNILFDKSGYCWLATEAGIVRFDGQYFKTFDAGGAPSAYSDRVFAMSLDANKNVHALTYNNVYLAVRTSDSLYASIPMQTKNIARMVSRGYAVMTSAVDSLVGIFYTYFPLRRGDWEMITGMPDGDYYIANGKNLGYIHGNKVEFAKNVEDDAHLTKITLLDSLYIQFNQFPNIQVWKKGILQSDIKKLKGPIEKNQAYRKEVYQLLWCENGTFIYSDSILYRIYVENNQLYTKIALQNIDIPNLCSLYYSSIENTYYLGSSTKGLYVVHPSLFYYPYVPENTFLSSFYSQAKTLDNDIFASNILFSQNTTPRVGRADKTDINTLFIDKNDTIWLEQDFELNKYNIHTKELVPLFPINTRLIKVIDDQQGDTKLFFTEKDIKVFKENTLTQTISPPIEKKIVFVLQLDDNNFLLATQGGLKWYNLKQNKIYKSVLDSISLRNVYLDNAGQLWISSYGNGFYLYQDNKLYKMPDGPRQSMRIVHAFIDDGKGFFWLPTNNGLFKVAKKELISYAQGESKDVYYYMFSKLDGLKTNEFNGGCDPTYIWLKDSMLSLPSLEGLVWFYPFKTRPLYPDAKIFVDKIMVDEKPFVWSHEQIILSPNFQSFIIAVSSPYYGNADNIKLKYRIDGLNTQWLDLSDDRSLVIANMKPGTYTLVIRKMTGRVEHPYEILKIPFKIKLPFYYTLWFYGLLLILVIFVVRFVYKTRIRLLKESAIQLEEKVLERTEALDRMVKQLSQSEEALAKSNMVKDRVITMVLHDIRSPMRFLNTLSDHLAKSFVQMNKENLSQRLGEINNSIGSLYGFTEQFFTWATAMREDFIVQESTFSLQNLFDELKKLYTNIAKDRENELECLPTTIYCRTDYNILSVVLRNLIDNANKNTKNGRIIVYATLNKDYINIAVSDTGKGLNQEQIAEYINEHRGTANSKIGSKLILELLKKINGQLNIESSPDKGSVFNVKLKNHL